jgi:hypothetical protein
LRWPHRARYTGAMTDETHTRNIALLIDADNASSSTLDPVLTILAELGTVNIRRVYGNWSKPALKGWRDQTVRYGIEPQQQFDLTKGKNATDMKMTIDAMDLLYRGRVHGFGTSKTPEAFRQACTRYIDVTALRSAPAPEIPNGGNAPASAGKTEMDPALLKLLIDAYDAVKRDERGFVNLSELGERAGNRSSFDARNYGYKRLADLIGAVPNFQTERRDGGRIYVKRLR